LVNKAPKWKPSEQSARIHVKDAYMESLDKFGGLYQKLAEGPVPAAANCRGKWITRGGFEARVESEHFNGAWQGNVRKGKDEPE
jgi:hypothetical protein